MAAYRRVYDSRHLQADCQEPGSAPELYSRQSRMGYLFTDKMIHGVNSAFSPGQSVFNLCSTAARSLRTALLSPRLLRHPPRPVYDSSPEQFKGVARIVTASSQLGLAGQAQCEHLDDRYSPPPPLPSLTPATYPRTLPHSGDVTGSLQARRSSSLGAALATQTRASRRH